MYRLDCEKTIERSNKEGHKSNQSQIARQGTHRWLSRMKRWYLTHLPIESLLKQSSRPSFKDIQQPNRTQNTQDVIPTALVGWRFYGCFMEEQQTINFIIHDLKNCNNIHHITYTLSNYRAIHSIKNNNNKKQRTIDIIVKAHLIHKFEIYKQTSQIRHKHFRLTSIRLTKFIHTNTIFTYAKRFARLHPYEVHN
jgi:hypothetical protein